MKINILDEKTINKIAAGEVVQNPASVVKELLENSIDSGANAINIEIVSGGISKIRITDNGCGISEDDIKTAFMRHATSKINSENELFAIQTLGFRGEALSSIGAVSNLNIRSKTMDEEMGSSLKMDGGKFGEIKPVGAPSGTTITVSNLFFNTPARLKFLKNASVEGGYITEIVAKYILAYPEIAFNYTVNGKTVFSSQGNGELEGALSAVYGPQILGKIRFVSNTQDNISLCGYIGLPQFAMKSKRHQSFFVNRRYVSDNLLSSALKNAYGERLLKGNFPFAVLFLELPVNEIDVNIHPQKLMVKFRDMQKIDYLISETVDDCLNSSSIIGEIKINEESPKTDTNDNFPEKVPKKELPKIQSIDIPDEFALGFTKLSQIEDDDEENDEVLSNTDEIINNYVSGIVEKQTVQTVDPVIQEQMEMTAQKELLDNYHIIGTLFNTYLLLEQGEKLLILDQHAAHERILYDDIINKLNNNQSLTQLLLLPEEINLTADEILLLEKYSGEITEMGFIFEKIHENTILLKGVPLTFEDLGTTKLIDEMFFELSRLTINSPQMLREKLISAMCKKAIKANQPLNKTEVETLIEKYIKNGEVPTCPHGRPIIAVIKKSDIEKGFLRI